MIELTTFNSPREFEKNNFLENQELFSKKFFLGKVLPSRRPRFKYELLTPPELGVMIFQTATGDSTEGVLEQAKI